MSMQPNPFKSLRDKLSGADCSCRFLWGAGAGVALGELLRGTSLAGCSNELSGRSILLATRDQLAAGMALIELDGVASRIVILPPDTPWDQFPALIKKAGVDAIVSDYELPDRDCLNDLPRIKCSTTVQGTNVVRGQPRATEWVLLTSGTTSEPKMIVHNLASLTPPAGLTNPEAGVVWGTFYDIRRYGGLQIFLRAVLGSGSLVLSSAAEAPGHHLARLLEHGVTHLSGTPSHWRRTLMSPESRSIAPNYIRLSGEIADQPILNMLGKFYPKAAISHAFASTEAGVGFEVNDGRAGFPAALLGRHAGVEMRVCNGSLQIRSNRVASRYLDEENRELTNEEGFVDTGDMVELRGDRYYFLGRRNGVINVGGLKVYPEEVEAVINLHPWVRMSRVWPRKNPITGSVVSADVMLKDAPEQGSGAGDPAAVKTEILEICRQNLAAHKVPVIVRYVPSLEVAAAGKLVRHHA